MFALCISDFCFADAPTGATHNFTTGCHLFSIFVHALRGGYALLRLIPLETFILELSRFARAGERNRREERERESFVERPLYAPDALIVPRVRGEAERPLCSEWGALESAEPSACQRVNARRRERFLPC